MYSTDFSKAPIQGQAGAIVLAEGRSDARARDGVTWRQRLRDGSIRFELLTVDTVENAEAIAARHRSAGPVRRAVVLLGEERGYTNGVWRAEQQFPMAHNEHFHPTSSEQRAGRTPPRVADRPRKPRRRAHPTPPRRWTIFDTGSMFLGATRYRHPIAWAVTGRHWGPMVRAMRRMAGSVWHGVYWQFPWTLGTLATYRTRDDMLKFARGPEHRHLMQWIVSGTTHGNGGFIRLFATREELERQRVEGAADARAAYPGRDASAPVRLVPVETEADFQEFLALPRRGEPNHLASPLLESTLRSWRGGRAPGGGPVELLLAKRGDTPVGRTTVHVDDALDAKLGMRGGTLFGATWAAGEDDLHGLLSAVEERGRERGRLELFGPVSLLPNQTGGVITSGFDERGFMDSPWNAEWVPGAYEAAGYSRWDEGHTWLARLDEAAGEALSTSSTSAPSAGELEKVQIRIRRASRIRFARDVEQLRTLTNAAFAQLPYYTEISPAQMRAATDGLIALMDPALWLFADARETGKPVAFALAVPDITTVLQASGGRVGLGELAAIMGPRVFGSRVVGAREAILLIHGALPEVQGRGIVTLLWRQLEANLRAGGYTAIRSTVVEDANPASSRHIERLGGRPLHGHTYYRKRIEA